MWSKCFIALLLLVCSVQGTSIANRSQEATLTIVARQDANNESSSTTAAVSVIQQEETESKFYNIIHLLRFLSPSTLSRHFHNALKGEASWMTCELCSTAVALIRLYPSVSTTQTVFIEMCSTLGNQERNICSGLADLFGDEFVYILSHSNLTHSEICGMIISPSCGALEHNYPNDPKWLLPLLPLNATHERVLLAHGRIGRLVSSQNRSSTNTSSILHLSDIHLDQNYQVNAYAGCNEPLCCHSTSSHSIRSFPAGYWGSFGNCDSTLRTIQNLITTIAQDFSSQYKYLLFTGDYIAHDVWNTSRTEILNTTQVLNNLFRAHIPKGKVVIPVIGNHEGYPVNQFCPPQFGVARFSAQWLYEELLNQWSDWVPTEYHETFRQNGYYTLSDGHLRFIVLNMNYCARLNFWIAYGDLDMGGMLKWLQVELQKALANHQSVYIAGHIVPDTEECATHWVQAYNDIIEKYADIIKGQFFGHTHMDEVRLYYAAKNSSKAIGLAYVTPSVTTFGDVNPAFRLYNTDTSTGTVVDHRTYYLNLTDANRQHMLASPFFTPEPHWYFEYSARAAYNLSSMEPQEWHNLMSNINESKQHLHRYYQYYGRYNESQVNSKSDAFMLSLVRDKVFVRF